VPETDVSETDVPDPNLFVSTWTILRCAWTGAWGQTSVTSARKVSLPRPPEGVGPGEAGTAQSAKPSDIALVLSLYRPPGENQAWRAYRRAGGMWCLWRPR